VNPESQLELTRRAIDAFNSHDAEAMIELGVLEFDWSRSIAPNKGIYRGEAGVREFIDDQWSTFDELRVEPDEFLPRGRHVVVPITVRGRGRSGVPVRATSAQVYTFEDGRPARIKLFQTRDEALEAAVAEE
jgi:ketosteroid isomerase-like protein